MSIPDIAVLRASAEDLIQRCSVGQLNAILTGAVAAENNGTPFASNATAQSLITACQPLIDQASHDALAIFVRQMLTFLNSGGGGGGGSQLGDVFYTHPLSRKQYLYVVGNDLYYEITGLVVDGVPQMLTSDVGVNPPV